jgi:N-acetylmuramoyl-L-alanine amidase
MRRLNRENAAGRRPFRPAIILALIAVLSIIGYNFFKPDGDEPVSGETGPQVRYIPVIDPGHGGFDPGTASASGTLEKDLNLEISLKTDMLMRFLGYKTVMTRDMDVSVDETDAVSIRERKVSDIRNRVHLLNSTEDGVLISIHQNYFDQRQYKGAQVFYHGADNKSFADIMQESLRLLSPENTRQTKPISNVYLLNHSQKPAVLVECGFLSNEEEDALLKTPEYQRKLAMAITAGFLEWSKTGT